MACSNATPQITLNILLGSPLTLVASKLVFLIVHRKMHAVRALLLLDNAPSVVHPETSLLDKKKRSLRLQPPLITYIACESHYLLLLVCIQALQLPIAPSPSQLVLGYTIHFSTTSLP